MVQFVGLLDANGTVLEINQVALQGGGLQLPDVEGKPFWTTFWWQVSEEINKELREFIIRAAQGEFVRWDTTIYGRSSGKETIVIDASLCPVMDVGGNVVFICAEGRDITEKKAQEREIAQKNIELQGLLERIRELDEIKTQFFANVSHELRTPLALIIGPAERLLSSNTDVTPELQRDTAQTIVRNARMLLKHVNDLLDISKLEAKKLKIDLQETDVPELIRFVASHFELLANERRVDFRIETGQLYLSMVDPEKLQRIVMNLLSNAFKFVPAGGIVKCRLDMSGKEWILSVEDSGPGVKPEVRKVIFERFRQGDGAANRQFSGTGLGLAIVHEFVEMHKGSIEVLDSKLGGAKFQVKLPATHLSVSSQGKLIPELKLDRTTLDGLIEELRVPVSGKIKNETGQPLPANRDVVLVVEDNPEMNKFIVQSLEHDYQVISAFDGEEGLQKALIFQPSLIVTDIMMPRVSGVEMIAELRKKREMDETPILLLSAKADEELKIKLLEESAQDFITKPFNERDLQVRIRNLIAVKKTNQIIRDAEETKRLAVELINHDLRLRSEQLSELFEQTPSFMAVLRGPNHVFEFANSSYHKLVGHRSIVGKSLIEALPEIKDQGFIEILDRVFETGQPFTGNGVPVLMQREPGGALEQRDLNFIYQPLCDTNKVIVGVFVEGHDVTDQKRAEDALRMADRRKDEFLATLAHELRNPLAPIRHASTISQRNDATEDELKRSHEVIVRQV
ncbi:MAG TPA: histidine kinase dimerization/phospho-acceptor domain-containing protein, partial [Chitinophagaceae bacterium]|nr:histidine kinase dimerization/phospho-acceptor domain-containing protein [Chitinophagaceae bacterium]